MGAGKAERHVPQRWERALPLAAAAGLKRPINNSHAPQIPDWLSSLCCSSSTAQHRKSTHSVVTQRPTREAPVCTATRLTEQQQHSTQPPPAARQTTPATAPATCPEPTQRSTRSQAAAHRISCRCRRIVNASGANSIPRASVVQAPSDRVAAVRVGFVVRLAKPRSRRRSPPHTWPAVQTCIAAAALLRPPAVLDTSVEPHALLCCPARATSNRRAPYLPASLTARRP